MLALLALDRVLLSPYLRFVVFLRYSVVERPCRTTHAWRYSCSDFPTTSNFKIAKTRRRADFSHWVGGFSGRVSIGILVPIH